MSTLPITAVPAIVNCGSEPGSEGFFGKLLSAWSCQQARAARAVVDRHLKRYSDEELKEMGYTSIDVARVRAMSKFAMQDWQ